VISIYVIPTWFVPLFSNENDERPKIVLEQLFKILSPFRAVSLCPTSGIPTTISQPNASPTGKFGNITIILSQACTTYGPRVKCGLWRLSIWPAKPRILFSLLVSLIKTPFEWVKTNQLWPLDMSKKNLARHEIWVVHPCFKQTINIKTVPL